LIDFRSPSFPSFLPRIIAKNHAPLLVFALAESIPACPPTNFGVRSIFKHVGELYLQFVGWP
jgi:hypothetical protein